MRYLLALLALMLVAGAAFAWPMGDHNPALANGFGVDNTNWSMADGAYSETNYIYDPENYTWEQGVTVGRQGFTVEADVEMWLNMAFNATNIYFHIGRDPGANPTFSQNITGWLSSNNGQWLFISKAQSQPDLDDITKLHFINDIGNRAGQTAPDIPVRWFCTDNSGIENEMQYSAGGNNGQLTGVTWLLDQGQRGMHNFTIRCQIAPEQYQPDGHYEMDPILAASPVL